MDNEFENAETTQTSTWQDFQTNEINSLKSQIENLKVECEKYKRERDEAEQTLRTMQLPQTKKVSDFDKIFGGKK